jgi:hypothetical protein
MLRNRILRPDFFEDEVLARGPDRRVGYLYAGLILMADRDGRVEYKPQLIQAQIFPYEKDVPIELMLDYLAQPGEYVRQCVDNVRKCSDNVVTLSEHCNENVSEKIQIYQIDGRLYIQILNFSEDQKIHPHERKSKIPSPTKEAISLGKKTLSDNVKTMSENVFTMCLQCRSSSTYTFTSSCTCTCRTPKPETGINSEEGCENESPLVFSSNNSLPQEVEEEDFDKEGDEFEKEVQQELERTRNERKAKKQLCIEKRKQRMEAVKRKNEDEATLPLKNPKTRSPHSQKDPEEESHFKEFFDLYPAHRRKNKVLCLGLYRKAMKETDHKTLMTCLCARKASAEWQKAEGQYVPNIDNWMSTEPWKQAAPDEIPDFSTPKPVYTEHEQNFIRAFGEVPRVDFDMPRFWRPLVAWWDEQERRRERFHPHAHADENGPHGSLSYNHIELFWQRWCFEFESILDDNIVMFARVWGDFCRDVMKHHSPVGPDDLIPPNGFWWRKFWLEIWPKGGVVPCSDPNVKDITAPYGFAGFAKEE